MTFKLGKASMDQLVPADPSRGVVHPDLVAVVKRAIQLTTQDFGVHDGARTAKEQVALYAQGRTKPGKIVTQKDGYKNKSNHQLAVDGYGHGVDLVPWTKKGFVWDWDLIYPIAAAMAQASKDLGITIRWGGNWYEPMNYGTTVADMKAAVERYKAQHPGPDHIDGPHFELVT